MPDNGETQIPRFAGRVIPSRRRGICFSRHLTAGIRPLLLGATLAGSALAQTGAIPLAENIRGLGTTTRVLMIGAHPDDEDTQLIAWLARGRHVETAYLSLTRGDGGQNLIGNQLGPMLGLIRTEELLAARRIDGGRQYFARAFDFGFSKSLEETRRRWPRDSILKDMVMIVRAFKPHVIVDVWTGTPADGHGHHQYAGVLGREVFDAAADRVRFPADSVAGLQPWTVAKFYRGRRANGNLQINVGELDPLTGRTFSEIATISRSEHRSQGQGALPLAGPRMDGVQLEVSRVSEIGVPENGLFAGLDSSWARFAPVQLADSLRRALDSLPPLEHELRRTTSLVEPWTIVPLLATYVRLTERIGHWNQCSPWVRRSSCDQLLLDLTASIAEANRRATSALLAAAGVRIEATTTREVVANGDTISAAVAVYNHGKAPIGYGTAWQLGRGDPPPTFRAVAPDSAVRQTIALRAPAITSAWWLRRPRIGDLFSQDVIPMVTGEDRLVDHGVVVSLNIAGTDIVTSPLRVDFRAADAVLGEVRRPLAVVPKISVALDNTVEYARAGPFDRTYRVFVRSAASTAQRVGVSLHLPKGLKADTANLERMLAPFASEHVYFRVRGSLVAGRDSIVATAMTYLGEPFDSGYVAIEYDHIRPLRYYRRASVRLEAVNATFANLRVGYLRGVGDNVRPMLEELGIPVTELDPQTIARTPLSQFSTIVIGPRAYEANPAVMNPVTPSLMQFARDGGTVVMQYGQFELAQQPGPLPYAIAFAGRSADRVTDETAPVRVLDPGSPLLSRPNKITAEDFNGWVQERSLYMPRTFDARWRALFSMNDPNEPPNDGALLVAPVGKGVYVYTSMSFFRQLPAGHPGAAKLFINLLSADRQAATRPSVRSQTPRP